MCLTGTSHLFLLTFQVYDVTPFMDEHPGGDEVLLAVTGKPYCREVMYCTPNKGGWPFIYIAEKAWSTSI